MSNPEDIPAKAAGAWEQGLTGLLAATEFEIIPVTSALSEVEYLPQGARVSVTASPAKGIEATIELSSALSHLGFDVSPHLAARMVRDRHHLTDIVTRLAAEGIGRALVIAGDSDDPGGYFDSLELLRELDEINHSLQRVGIGGYPEGHPTIANSRLLEALKLKQRSASHIVTQMCFDPAITKRWIRSIRASGIDLPIHLGIPGVARVRKLVSISAKIGVGNSVRFLMKSGDLSRTLMKRGGYEPDQLVHAFVPSELESDAHVEGLHIYTFNDVRNTEAWRQRMLEAAHSASARTDLEGGI
jgi:methylenetetrahydrofolate reductase (NADPH)